MSPVSTVSTTVIRIAVSSPRISIPLSQPQCGDQHVDNLDSDERNDYPADTIDQQVARQDGRGAERPILDAAQRKWDEGNNDERVENDRGKDRALRGAEVHNVE